MPIKREPGESSRRIESGKTVDCRTCGGSVERKDLLNPQALELVHCEGSKLAYGCLITTPHHATFFWPPCWKCGAFMGCPLCVPQAKRDPQTGAWYCDDLVCKRCRVKVTLESLLNGGPLSKHFMRHGGNVVEWGTVDRPTPTLKDYPKEWVYVYAERCAALGIDLDEDDTAAWKAARAAFDKFVMGTITKPKGHYALLREKNRQNRQAKELAAKPEFQATDNDLPADCWDDSLTAQSAGSGEPTQ